MDLRMLEFGPKTAREVSSILNCLTKPGVINTVYEGRDV